MKRLLALLLVAACAALASMTSCGGDNGGNPDGSADGTLGDGPNNGDGGGCVVGCDGGNCKTLGMACSGGGDCCSGNCVAGSCQPPPCTSDNQKCTTSSQCCSGTCGTGGTCTPLNTMCETLGNACTSSAQCCSQFCLAGVCSEGSYCGQPGDLCATPADCCGGICTKTPSTATYGVCGQPPQGGAQCSMIDGVVCQPFTDAGLNLADGGLPSCGGSCCSRDCSPWGATKVFICQPASGCKPVGDICYKTSDCCNFDPTNPDGGPTEQCDVLYDGGPGTCHNPTGCKPNGDICRLQTNSCNATDKCCAGTVQVDDTCHQDNLGIPRCGFAGDAGCIPSNGACSSSADCCNIAPCVPSGDGGFTCYPGPCVPVSGVCTNDADCCAGGHCYIPGGQTTGTCQPNSDAGADAGCAFYGQTCSTASDCCNGVPCTNGHCEIPVF